MSARNDTDNPLGARSIVHLASMLQSGAVDAVEVAETTLATIAAACADQAIFLHLTPQRALAEARDASLRLKRGRSLGLLDGIPVAWKDLFDIRGLPTTAGSKVLAEAAPADADAAVVDRLRRAGMVTIGRVNMSEFAFSGIGINPHHGTPNNPASTDVPRIPGGSSSDLRSRLLDPSFPFPSAPTPADRFVSPRR